MPDKSIGNYACPHCQKSLKGQFLRTSSAPGERKFLPLRGIVLCPFCRSVLHPNPHPMAQKMLLAFLPFTASFILLPLFPEYSSWLVGVLLIFLLGGMGICAYIYFKFLRHWPQFSAEANSESSLFRPPEP